MSRRSKFFLKALFLVCLAQFNHGGLTNAQVQTLKQPAAKAAATEKTPPAEIAADYSQEAMVIEQIKLVYRFEKDGTGQRDFSLRVRVQSEAALERLVNWYFPTPQPTKSSTSISSACASPTARSSTPRPATCRT